MNLSDLNAGQSARLVSIQGSDAFVERMAEIGLCPGVEIHVEQKLPLKGPVVVKYLSTRLAIRLNDAQNFKVDAI